MNETKESGKCKGNNPFDRPRYRWEDNIKMNLKGNGCGDME
jgi:hypothetical protein